MRTRHKIVSEKRGESRLRVDLFFPLQRDYSKEVINIKAKFFISNDVFSMINNKSLRTSFEAFPLIGNDITKSSRYSRLKSISGFYPQFARKENFVVEISSCVTWACDSDSGERKS